MNLFPLLFISLFILGAAAKNETAIVRNTPRCALTCSLASLTAAHCNLSDVASCLCPDSSLQAKLSTCIQKTCSFQDQLIAAEVGQQLCAAYPKESRSATVRTLSIVLFCITFVFLVLRALSRWIVFGQLWVDDWVSVFTTVFLIAGAVLQLIACEKGFGRHYWNINPKEGPTLAKIFYALQVVYATIQVSTKLTILLLYVRIFPMERFQRICKIFIVFLVAGGVAFTLVVLFQCWPVSSLWDRTTPGQCVNITAVGYAGAGISIFEDLVIFALPLPVLNTLTIDRRKKINIMLLFSIASFACVTSMVRLKYLITLRNSYDGTWDNVTILIWSMIEVDTTLICGCLLSLRPLFKKINHSHTVDSKERVSSGKVGRPVAAIKDREYANLSTDRIPLETIHEEAQPRLSNSKSKC
ncbi:hypothetical protein BGZ60DRAFT_418938 [Tricladium varicosporioides]|nr:hypothetical protein BGZ60DRAFT_418938 [Hymenoscyphus varicosporioides]